MHNHHSSIATVRRFEHVIIFLSGIHLCTLNDNDQKVKGKECKCCIINSDNHINFIRSNEL